jgi:hypothetical protein
VKDKRLGWLNRQVFWQALRVTDTWMAWGSEEMERISDCGEKESYWYFIYIVQGNGGERDHEDLTWMKPRMLSW